MSRFIKIRGLEGWLAGLALTGGVILTLGALYLSGLNIYYSALGLVELTGGSVIANDTSLIWPSLTVIKGGQVGLFFGLLIGLMASVLQTLFWLTPDDENRSQPMRIVSIFAAVLMVYDIGSTWWYLSNGVLLDLSQGWLSGLLRAAVLLGITFIALSFGAELWFALGVDLTLANWHTGLMAWGRMTSGLLTGVWNVVTSLREPMPTHPRSNAALSPPRTPSLPGRNQLDD